MPKKLRVIKNSYSDKEMDEAWNRVKNKPALSLKEVLKNEISDAEADRIFDKYKDGKNITLKESIKIAARHEKKHRHS